MEAVKQDNPNKRKATYLLCLFGSKKVNYGSVILHDDSIQQVKRSSVYSVREYD